MRRFYQIIRWKNLLLILLVFSLIRYYLMPIFHIESGLNNLTYYLVLLNVLLITIGGYLINDINDLDADRINKPDSVWISDVFTKKTAYLFYLILNLIAIGIALYISYLTQYLWVLFYYFIPIVLLYFYAVLFKKNLLIDNLIVALLIAYSIVFLLLVDDKMQAMDVPVPGLGFHSVIVFLACFAFLTNLMRELAKDAQDELGDQVAGYDSLFIRYGMGRVKRWSNFILGLFFVSIVVVVIKVWPSQKMLGIYLLFAVIPFLFLLFIQLGKVRKNSDFASISKLLKMLMFVGLLAVFMIKSYAK